MARAAMREARAFPLFIGALMACASCARSWVEMPPYPLAGDACVPSDACDWARGFDDLVVFAIDGATLVETPRFRNTGEPVPDNAECRAIAPGIDLVGHVERSARGTQARRVIVAGEMFANADHFRPGTRALLAVVVLDDDNLWMARPWPQVENDVMTFPQTGGCGSVLVDVPVDDILTAAGDCASYADAVDDRLITGAVCYQPNF